MNKKLHKIGGFATALLMATTILVPANVSAQTTTNQCSGLIRNLTLGSTGSDVVVLQTFLETRGYMTMPTGVSKGYFGGLTQSALAKYQASNAIAPAVGYFGPLTRGKLVAACATNSNPGNGNNNGNNGELKGGAGDLTITERSSGIENEVLEGDEEVNVLGFEAEADGSDVEVTSVKVSFEKTDTAGSKRFNRYAEEVQIMLGNKVVGTADVSDFSESNGVYTRSISLDKAIIREDDKERLYVSVTALNNIDSNDIGKDWTVDLDQVRFEDATGAILSDSSFNVTEVFTFEDLSSNGDVQLTVSDDDSSINDAHTVEVKDSGDTNGVEILSFTIEAEGSDLEFNSLSINLESIGAGVTEIANDFRLMMDGEEVGEVSIDGGSFASSSDMTRTLTFSNLDDDNVVIDKDDTVSFTLEADINDVDGGFSNGDSLSTTLDASNIDADDENGDSVTDLSGSAESNDIAFASTGIMLSAGSSDSSSRVLNLDTTNLDDQGKFEIVFDIKAFDKTAFVALTGTSTSALANAAGVYVYVEDVNNNDVEIAGGVTTVVLERVSGGTLSGNYVRINAGQTVTLRATVYHDAATTGNYRAQLGQVNFAQTAIAGTAIQTAVPSSDYQSPSEQILN